MSDQQEDVERTRMLELNFHHGERAHDRHDEYYHKANEATLVQANWPCGQRC